MELKIHDLIEAYVEQAPNDIALVQGDSVLSYSEINKEANQLAHYLRHSDLKPDNIIAIALDRSPSLIIAMLAILKADCAYLPLDQNQPADRLQYLLEDTQAPILIIHSKDQGHFKKFQGRIILIDQEKPSIELEPTNNPIAAATANNLAYIIYTSGSTGKPKGVLIEHKSVVNYINWFKYYSDGKPQTIIDFSSNPIFDMAVTTTITSLALGYRIIICSDEIKKDIRSYLHFLRENKINVIKITPSYFKLQLLEAAHLRLDLPDLKEIILGGEALQTKDCRKWLAIYPNHILFNEYGPTEATVAVSAFKVTKENLEQLGWIVPIGKPHADFDFHWALINDNQESLGELHIAGRCLARGYLHEPGLTTKLFIDRAINNQSSSQQRWYKTGDLCQMTKEGELEFIKRIDDQVKIRGYRIEPAEIEACLVSHPLIREACICARDNALGEKELIAYYLLADTNKPVASKELRNYMQERLADYMIPIFFICLTHFPLNANGKLDKKVLPEPLIDENDIVSAKTKQEQDLIDIWKQVFHIKNIGTTSNFFELGGHSLIAARLLTEIENKLGKRIKLEDLYREKTINNLLPIIENAKRTEKQDLSASHLATTKYIPLGDFQFIFWIAKLFEPKIKQLNIIARRRVSGRLNADVLQLALEKIIKKHEVLFYRPVTYFPAQMLAVNSKVATTIEDLTELTENEQEEKLCASLDALLKRKWFREGQTFFMRLFYLNANESEIQVSVPHINFDDASEEIFFTDLSEAYLELSQKQYVRPLPSMPQYRNYVFYEHNHLNQALERDIHFWQTYLQDATLINLPEIEIVHGMKGEPYSTYFVLPKDFIENTHQICKKSSLTITDLFCAAIGLSLSKAVGQLNNKVFMNIIRSIRNRADHEKLIGCFLRLDPIKVDLKTKQNLMQLAKSIQQSRIETEPYQACSGMVKLACLNNNYQKRIFRNTFFYLFSTVYSWMFSKLKLNSKVLMMYGRLNRLRKKNRFMIVINLLNNFVSPTSERNLFGLRLKDTTIHRYDLSNIDNVLDISFLKNEIMTQSYLVVSGNLTPSFREQIGNEIINVIRHFDEFSEVSYPSSVAVSLD